MTEELAIRVFGPRISECSSTGSINDDTTHIDGHLYSSTTDIISSDRTEKSARRPSLLPPRPTTLAAVSMAANSLIVGLILGYTSPALPSLHADVEGRHFRAPTVHEDSWIASLAALSALVGGLCGGPLADRFGRKTTAIFLLLPVSLGWLMVVLAADIWYLYVGRLLTGLGAGVVQLVVPVYVAEVAPTSHRGMLLSLHALCLNAGSLVSNVVGAFVTWRWLAVVNIGVCAVAALALAFIPESPRWLLLRGRRLAAVQSLARLRGIDVAAEEVRTEVASIEESVKDVSAGVIKLADFQQRRLYHPLLLTLGMASIQIGSGIDIIWFYAVSIFQAASGGSESTRSQGNATMRAFVSSMVVGVVAVFGNLVSAAVTDRAGRRPMLIISGAVMAVSMSAMGTYFYLQETGASATIGQMHWVPVLSLVVYLLGYDLAWGPLPSSMMGELLPNKSRGVAGSVTVAWLWLSIFFLTKFYVDVVEALRMSGAFWLFSFFSFIGILFAIFALPETRGKSLEDIEKIFQ